MIENQIGLSNEQYAIFDYPDEGWQQTLADNQALCADGIARVQQITEGVQLIDQAHKDLCELIADINCHLLILEDVPKRIAESVALIAKGLSAIHFSQQPEDQQP